MTPVFFTLGRCPPHHVRRVALRRLHAHPPRLRWYAPPALARTLALPLTRALAQTLTATPTLTLTPTPTPTLTLTLNRDPSPNPHRNPNPNQGRPTRRPAPLGR